MKNTVETAAGCRYQTKMDKRSGFWQIDLTERATGRPLGKSFPLHCQRRHPELAKIPTYLT